MSRDAAPPVRLLNRSHAAGNSKWTVYFDHIQAENGVEVHNYVVLKPPSGRSDHITGVTVLPLIGDEAVLLRAYRHPLEQYFWELPRGFVEPGEEPGLAALRELEEETGLICAPENLHPLGLMTPEASTIIGKGALYVAVDCRAGGRRVEDEPGLGAVHRIARPELRAMLERNEIEDGFTMATLYRAMRFWAP
ncbi:NUDIX hydrolase [Ferrovibrio sp.]|uniref:NUDIX hydrolase n=1 Tax=Ferrovibrio sp. TaxID=1917215 RepID=UPI001B764AE7|nr:NUDIX hydrolase [Ferrovibrio sp.]MBP7066385.1 NUDIX hydrolase [Ferrovibrio sp.]